MMKPTRRGTHTVSTAMPSNIPTKGRIVYAGGAASDNGVTSWRDRATTFYGDANPVR